MLVRRLAVVGAIAVAMTVLGVMTMGVAETVKFGLYGIAAAAVLLLLMRLLGGRSSAQPPASDKSKAGSSKPPQGGAKG